MRDVEFTTEEVADLLERTPFTIRQWIRAGRFEGAYLLNNSTRLGLRIPAAAVLEVAASFGPTKLSQVATVVQDARRMQKEALAQC